MDRGSVGRLFRAEPLPTRLHPGPPRPGSAQNAWVGLREALPPVPPAWKKVELRADAALRARLAGEPPAVPEPGTAFELYRLLVEAAYGEHDDPWSWRGSAQAAFASRVALFASWLVRSGGGVVAACTADLVRLARDRGASPACRSPWHDPFSLGLRAALTGAPPPAFDAARDTALALAGPEDWAGRAFFAFLLADDGPVAHALQFEATLSGAVRQGVDPSGEPKLAPLLVELRPTRAAGWRGRRRGPLAMGSVQVDPARVAASAMAVAARHGEPAVPALFWLYRQADSGDRELFAKAMLETREDDALALLVPDLHRAAPRAALKRAAAVDPAWTFGRCLALLAAGRGGVVVRHRLRDMVDRHGIDEARRWSAGLDAKSRAFLEDLMRPAAAVDLAPRRDWPPVLREPPWRDAARRWSDGPILELDALPTPFACRPTGRLEPSAHRRGRALVFSSVGDLARFLGEAAAGPERDLLLGTLPLSELAPGAGAPEADVLSWLDRRLTEIEARGDAYPCGSLYAGLHDGLEHQAAALALMLWNRAGPALRRTFLDLDGQTGDPAPAVLDRFGAAAVPGLVRLLEADPLRGLDRFAQVDAAEIAPAAARSLRGDKALHVLALAWLLRHPAAAAAGLLPAALGGPGAAREEAGYALRRLCAGSPRRAAAVEAVAARYAAVDPRVGAAASAVLGRDPLFDVPDAVPALPGWFAPADLRRPVLVGRGVLPDEAITLVGEMLAFSTREHIYAGLGELKRHCTADSLGAFAWDLFSAWLGRGAPGQGFWAIRAVGWLGDDACARRLTTEIRRWLDTKARPQAAMGIEALADIGSDVALIQLSGLAERLGSKSLRAKAARHLAETAEARGLASDALADRLAPDLGLDARGGLDLDFGARRFRAGFGGDLQPVVRDAAGAELKGLPRPGKADDPERAAAAAALWTTLKRNARAVVGLQLARLEAMLASARRVTPEVFRSCFAGHPVIGHAARRLVWVRHAAAAPPLAFTVAEDGRFVAADGVEVELDAPGGPGTVGLVHPLVLPPADLAAWRQRFARLGLAQPFPQLDREVHRLTHAESGSGSLHRFHGIRVEAGWLRGMGTRVWPFERPREDGLMWRLERKIALADGTVGSVRLGFAPGIRVGTPEADEPARALLTLDLLGPGEGDDRAGAAFGDLDPVAASELIRSIADLAGRGAHPTREVWVAGSVEGSGTPVQ